MTEIPIELLTTDALDGCACLLYGRSEVLSEHTADTQVLWDAIQPIGNIPWVGGVTVLIADRSYLHRWIILDCIRACESYEQPVPRPGGWDGRRSFMNTARNWVTHPCHQTCKNARMHQHQGQWDIRYTNQAICSKGHDILEKALLAHENAFPEKGMTPWQPQASADARLRAFRRIQILFAINNKLPNPAPLIVLK